MTFVGVIPAYNPPPAFVGVIDQIISKVDWPIVVVDDGTRPDLRPLFETLERSSRVTLIRHAVNRGKGAALKSALNHALVAFGRDIILITLDADGQHSINDMAELSRIAAQNPSNLVLGVRKMPFAETPLRSYVGNSMTRWLVWLMMGVSVSDTQTGLRAIPGFLAERLLRIEANGYDFELEMLVMSRHMRVGIVEHPIATIYDVGNTTSHFRPVVDSAKIYLVLFRFLIVAMLSSILDNTLFGYFLGLVSYPAASFFARCLTTPVNFIMLRRFVFYSQQNLGKIVVRYLIVVVGFFAFSNYLMLVLDNYAFSPVAAKVLVEAAIFPLNFLIQRDFVFSKRVS
jgi:glycosyltransferase involved in cell wall biosynthesis